MSTPIVRELNFDCLVGPTHFFGGLSLGNLASLNNKHCLSNPKKAALQGLEKMRYLADRGFLQGVLPPHDRPYIDTLRLLGFSGTPEIMLAKAHRQLGPLSLKLYSSSAMWAANAATVCPQSDSSDKKTHIIPANLVTMFHRSIESHFTTKLMRNIFSDRQFFRIHDPLPAHDLFSDEGAANHNRMCSHHGSKGLHIFIHGKEHSLEKQPTKLYPARQSRQASEALARNFGLDENHAIHWAQNPDAIDAGVFHNDVVCVANEKLLLCHEKAFLNQNEALNFIEEKYKLLYHDTPTIVIVSNKSLPLEDAVSSYLFNSQLLSKPNGRMLLFAPTDADRNPYASAVIKELVSNNNPIDEVAFFDVSQSMANGGGPACLRLRIPLLEDEINAIKPQVFMNKKLYEELRQIINYYYKENLESENLFDPLFLADCREALEHISNALGLRSLYDWQN